MKKLFQIIFVTCIMFTTNQQIKAQAFSQGASIISLGYGFPNLNKSILNIYDLYTDFKITGIGPFHAKYEYGVSDRIGMGLSVNYVQSAAEFKEAFGTTTYEYKNTWSSLKANVRLNFHFGNSDKFDPYFGFGIGYGAASTKWTSTDPDLTGLPSIKNPFPLGFETTIGARYYIAPAIGIYSEVGLAKSVIQLGLCFKFGGSSDGGGGGNRF